MKAHERSFVFMSMPSYYDIPFFQRAYVWDEENWQELLNNFLDQTESHFLGSIILKQESAASGSYPHFMIIDGQQRLTTLSILARACYDCLMENADQYDEAVVRGFDTDIHSLLFIKASKFAAQEDVKIQHSKLDAPAFQDVINGKYVDCLNEKGDIVSKYKGEDSKIVRCYLFFRKELHSYPLENVQKIWSLLTEENPKYLVNIDLAENENEQKIFDTVNSFGVRLSSSDTIKNTLFQTYIDQLRVKGFSDVREEATELYNATWEKSFEPDDETKEYWDTTRHYGRMTKDNLEVFLNAYAVINGFFDPSTDNMASLSKKYKDTVSSMNKEQIEEFLASISKYAVIYKNNFNNFDSDCLFNYNDYKLRLLHIIHTCDVATFYPYVLQLLFQSESGLLTDSELQKKFLELEQYIVLNAICKGSNKNYNNECVQFIRGKRTPSDMISSSKYISRRTFQDGLRSMRNNWLPTLLLFWVELYDRQNKYADIKDLKYDYTLEHIMPQKWQKNWSIKDVPVKDEEGNIVENEVEATANRSAAVYEIGNMTLLNSKLNSAISNGTFHTKVYGDGKAKHYVKNLADLYLTREVIENESWDEEKIYARTDKIQKEIEAVWNLEFEEDKPVHLEIDDKVSLEDFIKYFDGKSYLEIADEIDRADCSEETKIVLIMHLYQLFEDDTIYSLSSYRKNGPVFDKDALTVMDIVGSYIFGDMIDLLEAINKGNEEETVRFAVERVKNIIEDTKGPLTEEYFWSDIVCYVKNRYEEFYGSLYDQIKDLQVAPTVLSLCKILDDYYSAETSAEKAEVLATVKDDCQDSFIFNALYALMLYDAEKYSDAAVYLHKYVESGNTQIISKGNAYFYLGWCYQSNKNHKKAIEYYLKALEYNPNFAMACNNLGNAYYDVKDFESALKYFNKCIELDSNNIYAPNNKALALIKLKRIDELKAYITNPPRKLRKGIMDKANKAIANSNTGISDDETDELEITGSTNRTDKE